MSTKQRTAPLQGLRERRIFRNITQQELADAIGVSQSHYRQIEIGGVRLDVHRARVLARKLDCMIEDLI